MGKNPVKMRVMKFSEILAEVKKNPKWKVVTEHKNYFTVEDQDGYRAYFQVDHWGYEFENPHFYQSFDFSTVHLPNRKTGSGWQYAAIMPTDDIERIIKMLHKTLERSRQNIESGRERMDTRKPHTNRHYLV